MAEQQHRNKDDVRQKDFLFYIEELKSDQCFCEREKQPGKSFCYRCYKALPRDMQQALYQRIGNGYEQAYDEAATYISQEVL